MNYNNGYRKKGSVFEVFKIIFQIVGTFIILMVIGMSLVLALSAGKMEDKINDIKCSRDCHVPLMPKNEAFISSIG